jgi:hypothetical protein
VAGDEDEEPQIDSLILLDREVDKVTPLCTQLTYEGLIDEIFGINNGVHGRRSLWQAPAFMQTRQDPRIPCRLRICAAKHSGGR